MVEKSGSAGYAGAIDYMYALQVSGIKLGLKNITEFMNRLKNCHESFASVHIAGTNGKGSTAQFLGSILSSMGYRVGIYTSPHLVDFEERITVNGDRISRSEISRLVPLLRKAAPDDVTYFEFATALAFRYFSDMRVDIAVIETGLGGSFDATNIIIPLVSVITNVSIDHQEYMGCDLAGIAMEKSGIIKKSVPVVTAASCLDGGTVMKIINKKAADNGAPLYRIGCEFDITAVPGKGMFDSSYNFKYTGNFKSTGHGQEGVAAITGIEIPLSGDYQATNLSLALQTVAVLVKDQLLAGIKWEENKILKGISVTRWPGRLETISTHPRLILDGAHNEMAAQLLVEYLGNVCHKNVIFVLGIMKDKNVKAFIDLIRPIARTIVAVQPAYQRAMKLEELCPLLSGRCPELQVINGGTVKDGLKKAMELADVEDTVCVTGSLFTVGEVKALH